MHKNGFAEGDGEGFVDGLAESDAVGLRLSFAEGEADGDFEGNGEGFTLGLGLGFALGEGDEIPDGD